MQLQISSSWSTVFFRPCSCTIPANTRLAEDVLKTLEEVFRLRLQKTSSRRLQDVLVKTSIFVLAIRLQDVFKKPLQGIFKTSSRRFEDVFKTSCKDIFNTFSRRIIKLNRSYKHIFEKQSTRF